MKLRSIAILMIYSALFTACNLSDPAKLNPGASIISTLPPAGTFPTATIPAYAPPIINLEPTSVTPLLPQQAVLDQAFEVIALIRDQDMISLAAYVHPEDGVRLSPYAFVNDTDQVFLPEGVASLPSMSRTFIWGTYSGSGAPIDASFGQYYSEFIYDQDYILAPQVSLNHRLGVSTSMDNIAEFYPGSMVVEFYFPGFDPQLEGMDWKSLRLVFTPADSTWYLTAIIHDQWTT